MERSVKKNPLWMVNVRRGQLQQTKVVFCRENRKDRKYFPTRTSLARLAPLMEGCVVGLSPNYVDLILYLG